MNKKTILKLLLIFLICIMYKPIEVKAEQYLIEIEEPDTSYLGTKIEITGDNRAKLEGLVQGEAGGEGFIGAALVAQCIRDRMVDTNIYDMDTIKGNGQFSAEYKTDINQDVKDAVKYIFDEGMSAVQHRAYFYYSMGGYFGSKGYTVVKGYVKSVRMINTYPFHEGNTTEYLFTYKNHKFFDRLSDSKTKDFAMSNKRTGWNYIICSKEYSWDIKTMVSVDSGQAESQVKINEVDFNTLETIKEEAGLSSYNPSLPTLNNLSLRERLEIGRLQDELNGNLNYTGFIRRLVLLIGILIIFYSVLLFFAYLFDSHNIFLEISLLKILTLNKIMANQDDESIVNTRVDGVLVVDLKNIIIIVIIGLGMGVIIVSGKFFAIIQTLIDVINYIFGFFSNI